MKMVKAVATLLLIALAFGGGYLVRATRTATAASTERKILYYVDPMHPAYTSDKPGVAPDCGMTLEPVYADEAGLNPARGNTLEPVDTDAAPRSKPGAIKIAPERQQLIGVRFANVELSEPARSIRSVGKVTFDETRVAHVHTRIDGWIEKVFVDFTGDFVRQGQPMLTIYSPEMLASQQELLLAARARDLMRNNPLASAAEHGNSLFEAAQTTSGAVATQRRSNRAGAQDRPAHSQHHAVCARRRFRHRTERVSQPEGHAGQRPLHDHRPEPNLDRRRRFRVGHRLDQGRRPCVRLFSEREHAARLPSR